MTTKDWKRGGLTLKINTPNFDSRKRTNQVSRRSRFHNRTYTLTYSYASGQCKDVALGKGLVVETGESGMSPRVAPRDAGRANARSIGLVRFRR